MREMCDYIGITIGPIYDTLMEASTPAALWFASSMFSNITRRLCKEIKKEIADAEIFSPFFSEETQSDDGIGKYHDRIIFSTNLYHKEKLNKMIIKVKEETSNDFPKEVIKDGKNIFFQQYIQIHYVVVNSKDILGKNCILTLSKYLDILELMKTFPKDNLGNPIKQLFLGEKNGENRYIKNSGLFSSISNDKNQLKKSLDTIWTIEEIASSHNNVTDDFKKYKYYAVVQADGDNMGDFLSGLEETEVKEFSKALLVYAEKTAKLIGAYKGMTVYAGGDDLLFLAPVENDAEKTVFELCNEIREYFKRQLEATFPAKAEVLPTLSFGIAIQYIKYPLYEALKTAQKLLRFAKKDKHSKNKTAIEVQKHSGRNIQLVFSHYDYIEFKEMIKPEKKFEKETETTTAVMRTLQQFKNIFLFLDQKVIKDNIDEECYKNIWMNFFDNPEQEPAKDYIKEIGKTYYNTFLKKHVEIVIPKRNTLDEKQEVLEYDSLQVLLHLLWLRKFLVEKGGEQ